MGLVGIRIERFVVSCYEMLAHSISVSFHLHSYDPSCFDSTDSLGLALVMLLNIVLAGPLQ